jgi:anti-anti-sigma factor
MFAIKTQGAVEVVIPNCPLKQEQAGELRDSVEHCLGGGIPMIVLNLNDVPLVDSAGLEALLDVSDAVRAQGGAIKLAGLNPLCDDILKVSGVGARFEIYPDEKAAVRSFVQ